MHRLTRIGDASEAIEVEETAENEVTHMKLRKINRRVVSITTVMKIGRMNFTPR